MSRLSNRLINFDGQTLFKVLQSGTFTVPDTVSAPSPIGVSSGISPSTLFDTVRAVAGGMLFAAFSNQSGTGAYDFQYPIKAGDVIAISAISSNAADLTINGVKVYKIADTSITVAGVLGFYG